MKKLLFIIVGLISLTGCYSDNNFDTNKKTEYIISQSEDSNYVEILTDLVIRETIEKNGKKTIDTLTTVVNKDGSRTTMTNKEFRKKYSK